MPYKIANLEIVNSNIGVSALASIAEPFTDTTVAVPTASAARGVVCGKGAEGSILQLGVAAMAVRVTTAGVAYNHLGARLTLPTAASIPITAAHATHARWDIVVMTAAGTYAVRAGTPAGSPADPTLIAGDVPLARVVVDANATTIVTAKITDLRCRTYVAGTNISQSLKTYSAAGRNGAGSITVTGTKVGDLVVGALGFVTATGAITALSNASFESVVTVADAIQQSSGSNLTANTYVFFVQPQS